MRGETERARALAEAGRRLAAPGDTSAKLWETARLAARTVPGCDHAGITLVRRGAGLATPVYTGPTALAADQLQYDLDEGPCVEVAREGVRWRRLVDTATDDTWPRFARGARDLGVGSVISCALHAPKGVIGALNLYAEAPGCYGPGAREVALLFAAQAGSLLAAARAADSLRRAIETRERVGVATGILMERHKMPADRALERLAEVARNEGVPVREVADRVIETGRDPGRG
ncbi:GAF and ANTAR domain-containing protein [Streptomonospora sp. S1-112]|uniref:GAF and ANTAR domain-containing protein n=1 Tax=Streptomonospora mangrovi TaxID=2883123 RepID=A0A9X3SHN9_9ACTN|nr:GAF and ANTAR domain-containing protein [Streptomonospora mangrovi]MDA0567375.1 GAF and ANTAR domain-containing protein [Streptomonospora mangrovi]